MVKVFFDIVLPVFIVALLGGAVGRWRKLPIGPISALVFYLFSPALTFYSMATTRLSASVSAKIVAVMLLTWVVMLIFATIWSTLRRHDPSMRAGFALAATSPNVGNMGLPVAQLAFGSVGLQVGVMNFVAGSVLTNSAGIAVASMAGGSRMEALRAPFRYPSLYAAALGVLVNVFAIHLPPAIDSPAKSLAGATVPTMLCVLGLQLQAKTSESENLLETIVVNAARLLVAPTVAYLAAIALGLGNVPRGTLVVLAAMPTAVIATILATEFGARPSFVTRVVITSTIASIFSLSILISLVR